MSTKSDKGKPTLRVVGDTAGDPLCADYGPPIGAARQAGGGVAASTKKPRKPFKTAFVQVPARWITALEDAKADRSTYRTRPETSC